MIYCNLNLIKINTILDTKTDRVQSVDMLRGLAALFVCIFHFTNGNQDFLSNHFWLKQIGSHGWVGVEIFFIISGYIIPYSLKKDEYKLRDFSKFLSKRLARLEPPYFISILILILLNYLGTYSPYYKGQHYDINYHNLLLHVFHLNDLLKEPWLNPVYWTLAIELQFYLLIGLTFTLIDSRKSLVFVLTLLCFLLPTMLEIPSTVFKYIPYFSLGILIFKRKSNKNQKQYTVFLELLLLVIIYLQFSVIPFIASTFSWLIISSSINWNNKWLLKLGTISYSFYLIHIPFGGKLINLSINFFKTDVSRSFALLVILFLTLIVSYVFYRFVELPATKFSQFIIKNRSIVS